MDGVFVQEGGETMETTLSFFHDLETWLIVWSAMAIVCQESSQGNSDGLQ